MRLLIALTALVGIYIGVSAMPAPLAPATLGDSAVVAAQQPVPDVKIDVDTDGEWWENPTWIAIGAIGLVLLIVIVAMAARGGGTTVIKE